jgi:hypothetical protein
MGANSRYDKSERTSRGDEQEVFGTSESGGHDRSGTET